MINRRTLLSSTIALPTIWTQAGRAQEPLVVLGWGGYTDQGVLDRFRVETGIEVIIDQIGAYDEIFLRMRSGGRGRYSVLPPHHGLVPMMLAGNLIQPLDEGLIPRLAEVDARLLLPDTTVVDGRRGAVPLIWGTCPCIYNADLLPEPPTSWAELDSDAFTGRIGMQDDSFGHMNLWGRVSAGDTVPILTPAQFDATTSILENLKRNRVAHFTPYAADLTAHLANGSILLTTTGWEGMLLLPEAAGANLQIARLAPGDFSWMQTLAIAADAPMPEVAHQFINFMLGPEEQAGLAHRTQRNIVHPGAPPFIDEPLRNLTAYDDLDAVLSQSPILDFPPVGETMDGTATYLDWVTAWEQIRLVKSEAAL
jgi:spermidine/putrescine transport system substrate-binding protein